MSDPNVILPADNLPREARALLIAIAQGESDPTARREGISPYFVLYGGGSFEGMPNRDGYNGFPDWGGKDNSHAAGRYQFEPATWKGIVQHFGAAIPNFRNPGDQDWGAWFLAQQDYNARTGASLLADLRAGNTGRIGGVLRPTWTSMTDGTFPDRYDAALAAVPDALPAAAPAPQPAPPPRRAPVPAPIPVPLPPVAVPPVNQLPPVPLPAPPPIAFPVAGQLPPDVLAKAPWWMLPTLGGMVLAIFAGALAASCFMDNDTLRTQMFAIAGSGFTMMLGYFFGSSAGSQKKDDVIAAKTPMPPSP